MTKAGKEPIALRENMPEFRLEEIVLSVGYPGEEREAVSKETCGHRLAHVFGTVRSVSDRLIIIQDINPKRDKDISFGGMSGGPIFKFDEKNGSYEFIGLNYEGKGFKRKNIHDEIEFGDDIWIYGFPLYGQLFQEMLDSNWKEF